MHSLQSPVSYIGLSPHLHLSTRNHLQLSCRINECMIMEWSDDCRCRCLTNIDSLRQWQREYFHARSRHSEQSGYRTQFFVVVVVLFSPCFSLIWSIHLSLPAVDQLIDDISVMHGHTDVHSTQHTLTRKLVSCSCVRRDRIINGRVNHLEKCVFFSRSYVEMPKEMMPSKLKLSLPPLSHFISFTSPMAQIEIHEI